MGLEYQFLTKEKANEFITLLEHVLQTDTWN